MEFVVEEKLKKKDYDYNKILESVNNKYTEIKNSEEVDKYESLKLDYLLNTTVKELRKIALYYELNIRKKNKSDLIESIVFFEMNKENIDIVDNRKLMWHYFETLKRDIFFKKYIIID